MFQEARKEQDRWWVSNRWGHRLELPCRRDYADRSMAIGTPGTGRRKDPKMPRVVTAQMANLLASLDRPLYLIDTRRDGVGAQSSWSPREFASLIPDALPQHLTYAGKSGWGA